MTKGLESLRPSAGRRAEIQLARELHALHAERDALLGLDLDARLVDLDAESQVEVRAAYQRGLDRQPSLAALAELTREIDELSAEVGRQRSSIPKTDSRSIPTLS